MSEDLTDLTPSAQAAMPPRAFSPDRRHFLQLTGLGASAVLLAGTATACGSASGRQETDQAQGRAGEAGDTLFVSGFQWGAPASFNPLGPIAAWPCSNNSMQLIYETLLRFNQIDGSLAPGLGSELQTPDDKTFVVPLQPGTRWQDGSDLTAEDVVFTFELAKDNAVSYSSLWTYLESVTAVDDRTVKFVCKDKPFNPGSVRQAIAATFILPKSVFGGLTGSALSTEKNLKPLGSGPFTLDKQDQTQITLKRTDSYWGSELYGTPAMTTIVHPIFKSGNDGDLKLQSGEIDASQQFTPQIWKMWEDLDRPVSTWLKEKPYHLPGNLPLLIMNLSVKGLDNPQVRRALAHAIDYPNIATTAMSNYSEPANASLIVPTGYEERFYDKGAVEADGWTYDPKKAIEILETELEAKKGSDGIYVLPDGTKLGGWKLITPTGWTDWNTACEIVAKSAQAVGIGITTEFPQAPVMQEAMQNGNFQLCMFSYSGVSAASPWIRFREALDDRDIPPAGKTAFSNYNRFSHPEVPGLLDQAGGATTDDARKAAYSALDRIYRENIPVIPLMYRPLEFYQFSSTNWTGFPTAEDPYAPPMWQGAGIQWLFKIKKIGS